MTKPSENRQTQALPLLQLFANRATDRPSLSRVRPAFYQSRELTAWV